MVSGGEDVGVGVLVSAGRQGRFVILPKDGSCLSVVQSV